MPTNPLPAIVYRFVRSTAFLLAHDSIETLEKKGFVAEEEIPFVTNVGERVKVTIQSEITDGSLGVFSEIGKTKATVPVRAKKVAVLDSAELLEVKRNLSKAKTLVPGNWPVHMVPTFPGADLEAKTFMFLLAEKTTELVIGMLKSVVQAGEKEQEALQLEMEGLVDNKNPDLQEQDFSMPTPECIQDLFAKSSLKFVRKEDFNLDAKSYKSLLEMKFPEFVNNILSKIEDYNDIISELEKYGIKLRNLNNIYFVYDQENENVLICSTLLK